MSFQDADHLLCMCWKVAEAIRPGWQSDVSMTGSDDEADLIDGRATADLNDLMPRRPSQAERDAARSLPPSARKPGQLASLRLADSARSSRGSGDRESGGSHADSARSRDRESRGSGDREAGGSHAESAVSRRERELELWERENGASSPFASARVSVALLLRFQPCRHLRPA